jgi:threonine dehydratase
MFLMVDITTIRAAATRLIGHARLTPMLQSPFLDRIAGRRVYVKAECLQHTGSFKYRGAWAAVSALDPVTRARGVLAFSSGNHAQGIALAASQHQVPSVIVMPSDAPAVKIENTRALGAEVVLYDREREDRSAVAAPLAEARGLTLIKPYDEKEVIAGQGTTGLEIAFQARCERIRNADVAVCCGGGGLATGVALALEADAPDLRVRTAEPAGFDDFARSLISGEREQNRRRSGSLCDAIVTPAPGFLSLPVISRLGGPGLVVTDEEAMRAMAAAFTRLRLVLEPGGAVALAAALYHPDEFQGDAVICIATGGNVDNAVFSEAISRFGDGS